MGRLHAPRSMATRTNFMNMIHLDTKKNDQRGVLTRMSLRSTHVKEMEVCGVITCRIGKRCRAPKLTALAAQRQFAPELRERQVLCLAAGAFSYCGTEVESNYCRQI